MRSPWRDTAGRRVAWFGLIAVVLLAHGLFAVRVLSSVLGWNSAPSPRRIEVTLMKPITPTAPPAVAPAAAPAPAPRPRRAVRVARASSAPRPARAASEPAFEPVAEGEPSRSRALLVAQALALAARLEQEAQAVAAAQAAASAAVAEVAAAAARAADAAIAGPARPPFEWPPSTRLTYTLTGLYRNGPLYGSAAVQWRRAGTHYQVQFDIHVSPFFDQHMFSDGQITADGLHPQHYDEAFEAPLVAPRVRRIEFLANEVVLANRTRAIRLPQTQDGASQFVQFVWMFSTRPETLVPGHVIDIPLALNNNLRRWHYQVVGTETLSLPFGTLDAVHLKPILDGPRRPNEYPFEIWTAPTLQYLPVRILVSIDDRNFADLSLDQLPLQAAPEPAPEDAAAASQPQPN